VGTWERL